MRNKLYVIVWVEGEKWHYYKKDFNKDEFKNGYVDYYIEVDSSGIIISDTYCCNYKGKKFSDCYDINLWD